MSGGALHDSQGVGGVAATHQRKLQQYMCNSVLSAVGGLTAEEAQNCFCLAHSVRPKRTAQAAVEAERGPLRGPRTSREGGLVLHTHNMVVTRMQYVVHVT